MSDVYCGNNRKNKDVISGRKRIGNRYECLRKGFGVGYNQPVDMDYAGEYSPIDKRKTWCGVSNRKPTGYHVIGSNYSCFLKGFGGGKTKKAKEAKKKKIRRKSVKKSRKRRSKKKTKKDKRKRRSKKKTKRKSRKRRKK
jgi:hypothetical protein